MTAISIPIEQLAPEIAPTNLVRQGKSGVLPAAIGFTGAALADLAALGRVDAVEPYPLTPDLDGIAVYDGSTAGKLGSGRSQRA